MVLVPTALAPPADSTATPRVALRLLLPTKVSSAERLYAPANSSQTTVECQVGRRCLVSRLPTLIAYPEVVGGMGAAVMRMGVTSGGRPLTMSKASCTRSSSPTSKASPSRHHHRPREGTGAHHTLSSRT